MKLLRKVSLQNIFSLFWKGFFLVFMFCVFGVFIYAFSEYILNYFKLAQCDWPKLGDYPPSLNPRRNNNKPNPHTNTFHRSNENTESRLRVMMFSDTHLLGLHKSPGWFERKRRDWLLYWSFQAAVSIHKPEVIFMLGDVMDQGLYADDEEFNDTLQRFYTMFAVLDHTPMHVLVGNHDIGFHSQVTPIHWKRFNEAFNITDVQLISMKGVHFVAINSIAMHEDECFMCSAAEKQLDEIELILKCSSSEFSDELCENVEVLKDYSRPIVLQHYPFFRTNKIKCRDYHLTPVSFSDNLNVAEEVLVSNIWSPKRSCLSLSASLMILNKVRPRAAYCGHTHVACTLPLLNNEGIEHTLPTFSRRDKPMPTFTLAIFTPDNYATVNCFLPQADQVAWFTLILIILASSTIFVCMITCIKGPFGLGAPLKERRCKSTK